MREEELRSKILCAMFLTLLLFSAFSIFRTSTKASSPLANVSIGLSSRETDWSTSNLGTITFDPQPYPGYSLPITIQRQTTPEPPYYQACYYPPSRHVHDHWEISGGLELVPPGQFPDSPLVTVKVTGPGSMTAVYVEIFDVTLESAENNGATSNLGTITIPYPSSPRNLPTTANIERGTVQALYETQVGYDFDHWETSGGVSVPDPYIGELTSVTVNGHGTLRAIYVATTPPNTPPETPTTPEWATTERVLLEGENTGFRSTAIDPDSDDVQITFDWGDGTMDTSGWVSSGSPVTQDHQWNIPGMFEVKAKATDDQNPPGESSWSSSLEVTVVTNSLEDVWAGYMVQSTADPITSVEGGWYVPEFGHDEYGLHGIWVGIGGNGPSSALLQTGVKAVTRPTEGDTRYCVFIEMVPGQHWADDPSKSGCHISAGDAIKASISEWQSTPGKWDISVESITRGWTLVAVVTYTPDQSVAEWIFEPGGGRTSIASSFTPIVFGGARLEIGSTVYDAGKVGHTLVVNLFRYNCIRDGVVCTSVSHLTDYNDFEILDTGNRPSPSVLPITSISLHSSADLHVYDSVGSHLGYNATNGFVDLQIPNSFYFEANGVQQAILFWPDEHSVELIGTEDGDFHLNTKNIINGTIELDAWINETISANETKTYLLLHQIQLADLMYSRTIIGFGCNFSIAIAIQNEGNYSETFDMSILANSTVIWTEPIVLGSGNSSIIDFTINTSILGKGWHNFTVNLTSVPGETNASDNLASLLILVTLQGDVDGDHDVDIFDVVRLAKDYGKPPPPLGDPNHDIDGDGDVDIFDLVIAAGHYGDSW